MTAVVLVPFDESKPVSTQKLSWDDGRTLQDNIQSLLGDTFYLQTPLFRPQNDRAGLFAYYNVPEQDQREGKQNVRTTRLAMSCGLFSLRFWGDVVLVRSFGGRWEDLEVKSIYGACCISSDLRMEIQTQVGCQLGVNNEIVPIPDWLGDAARQNYHDSAALARLANVMNISNNDQNDDNEEEEDDDDDKKSDADMDEKEETAPAENIVMQEEQSKVFVANSSLCLHCRGLSSSLCPDCEGAHFCDTPRSCRQTGWSHSCLCATWKAYTNHRKDISTFEWLGDWHQELTGRNCQMQTLPYEEFLAKLDINRECSSWWRTEMDGWAGGESQSATMVDASIRRSYIEGFAPIPIIAIPPQRRVTSQDLERAALDETNSLGLTILKSWKDYYSLRGIPSTSPVALLCTFPLTIYQAIVQYGEVPSTVAQMLKRPLRIHVVGAEKEMNFLDLFQEVGFLLPEDFQIELIFIVREDMLPPKCRGSTEDSRFSMKIDLTTNLAIAAKSGTYGASLDPNFDCGSGPPDMVLALNAGLYAYESWRSVVTFLHNHPGVVGVFTDYNEYSGVNCAAMGGEQSRKSLRINPFRQPRAMPVYSMNLPQFSNGYFYVFNEQELE